MKYKILIHIDKILFEWLTKMNYPLEILFYKVFLKKKEKKFSCIFFSQFISYRLNVDRSIFRILNETSFIEEKPVELLLSEDFFEEFLQIIQDG